MDIRKKRIYDDDHQRKISVRVKKESYTLELLPIFNSINSSNKGWTIDFTKYDTQPTLYCYIERNATLDEKFKAATSADDLGNIEYIAFFHNTYLTSLVSNMSKYNIYNGIYDVINSSVASVCALAFNEYSINNKISILKILKNGMQDKNIRKNIFNIIIDKIQTYIPQTYQIITADFTSNTIKMLFEIGALPYKVDAFINVWNAYITQILKLKNKIDSDGYYDEIGQWHYKYAAFELEYKLYINDYLGLITSIVKIVEGVELKKGYLEKNINTNKYKLLDYNYSITKENLIEEKSIL